jgi:Rhodanase C-terminal
MKRRGIKDVHQLSGGIHRYIEKYGPDGHFHGLNFTFDKRVAVKPTTATDSSSTYKVVGRCLECNKPFDELCGSRVCTVCRDLVLVCPDCRPGLREYHCQRHFEWKSCYFTFLDVFDRDQLLEQKDQLLSIRDSKYAPGPNCKNKNIRRTLSRQIEKLDSRIRWMDEHNLTKGVVNAPRRCRTCMEPHTVCDGRCWGFWKTDENQKVSESISGQQTVPMLPISVGDRVQPGSDWNTIRLGDKHDSSGALRAGVVVEVKSWAGNEKDCVAVMWDDMSGVKIRNMGKVQPQIYRWGVLARDGCTRVYDVCKEGSIKSSTVNN